MNQRQHPETTYLELTAVDQDTRPEHDRPVFVYLQLTGPNQLPIELGTGRSAVVLLATLFPDPQAAGNEYYAVKCLRDDPDPQYSEASALRFFTEAEQMWRWGKTGGNIVTYQGWGAIAKDLERKNTRGEIREFWWHDYFKGYDPDQEQDNPDQKRPRRAVLNNNSPEFKRIKTRLNLQGPFYILELCQGTLEDLLEDDTSWAALPPYKWIDGYWDALESALKVASGQVEEFSKHYLDPERPQRSGYDILNSFKTKPVLVEINDKRTVDHNPNYIRNHAVLELFNQIVESVAKLHSGSERVGVKPLAHRDLKPGNIFLQHPVGKFSDLSIRLSDLGYVITVPNIRFGETLLGDRRGLEYQAPGSQFYRAPEQAELPIEVRVNIKQQRDLVEVKGTKLNNIDINDWLLIDDIIREDESDTAVHPDGLQRVFKILDVKPTGHDVYDLLLNREVPGSRDRNLHAQITKASGFHTDGYSLGAILYDLASGGKNPEHFYTYCLRVFTRQFTRGVNKEENFDDVEAVTEVLATSDEKVEQLTFESRRKASLTPWQLTFGSRPKAHLVPGWKVSDSDMLLDQIVDTLYLNLSGEQRKRKIRNLRFRKVHFIRELLHDKRGVPIPREIIKLVVRCMLRDIPGAFYKSDQQFAYTSQESIEAAGEISEAVDKLLKLDEFGLPDEGYPPRLIENILFKLRCLMHTKVPVEPLTAQEPPLSQESLETQESFDESGASSTPVSQESLETQESSDESGASSAPPEETREAEVGSDGSGTPAPIVAPREDATLTE